MKKIILLLISGAFLSTGFTTTNYTVADTNDLYSSFNSSESVVVYSTLLGCTNENLTCAMLGFEWNEQDSQNSYTLISIDESPKRSKQLQNILEVKFIVEEDTIVIKPLSSESNTEISTNYQITSKLYVVPMSLLKRIKESKNSRIKIKSTDAVFDMDFEHIHRTHLNRFLNQVDVARQSDLSDID